MNLPDNYMSHVNYVTGPLHSGKTTSLRAWSDGRTDVAGISQPVIEGQRYFVDIQSGHRMLMDVPLEVEDAYTIGKYHFAISAFAWASDVLVEALDYEAVRYLIVDEIGPLEMQGKGLHAVLEELLLSPIPGLSTILVVRDYLLDEVLVRYGVKDMATPFSYPE